MDDGQRQRAAAMLARILEKDAHWTRGLDNRALVGAYAAMLAALLNEMDGLELVVRARNDAEGTVGYRVGRLGYATACSVGWDEQEAEWVVLK